MRKIAETFCIFLFAALLFSTLNFTAFATEKLYRIQGKILYRFFPILRAKAVKLRVENNNAAKRKIQNVSAIFLIEES